MSFKKNDLGDSGRLGKYSTGVFTSPLFEARLVRLIAVAAEEKIVPVRPGSRVFAWPPLQELFKVSVLHNNGGTIDRHISVFGSFTRPLPSTLGST